MEKGIVVKSPPFKWDEKKRNIVKALAEGVDTVEIIAEEHDISVRQIQRWRQRAEFIELLDELTIKAERHTVAGMLREIDKKMDGVGVGKTDWAKLQEMKIKLLGLEKHKLEHSGVVGVTFVDNIPDNRIKKADDGVIDV